MIIKALEYSYQMGCIKQNAPLLGHQEIVLSGGGQRIGIQGHLIRKMWLGIFFRLTNDGEQMLHQQEQPPGLVCDADGTSIVRWQCMVRKGQKANFHLASSGIRWVICLGVPKFSQLLSGADNPIDLKAVMRLKGNDAQKPQGNSTSWHKRVPQMLTLIIPSLLCTMVSSSKWR